MDDQDNQQQHPGADQSQGGEHEQEQGSQAPAQEDEQPQAPSASDLDQHQQFLCLLAAILYQRGGLGGVKDAYQNAKNLVQLCLEDEPAPPEEPAPQA